MGVNIMGRLSDKLQEIVVTSNPQTAGLAGEIRPFAGDTSAWPVIDGVRQLKGWAVCEGDILNEADYPDLCANLGGVGNSPWDNFAHPTGQTGTVGAGQFRLPKLNGLHLKSAGDNGNGAAACGDFQDQGTAANNLSATTQVGGTSVNVGSQTLTSTGNKNQFNSNQNNHSHQQVITNSTNTGSLPESTEAPAFQGGVNSTRFSNVVQTRPATSTWTSSNFSVSGTLPTANRDTATANRTATITDNNDETRPTSVAVSYIIALYNNLANVVSTKDLTASNVTVTNGLTADSVSATTYSGLPEATATQAGIVTKNRFLSKTLNTSITDPANQLSDRQDLEFSGLEIGKWYRVRIKARISNTTGDNFAVFNMQNGGVSVAGVTGLTQNAVSAYYSEGLFQATATTLLTNFASWNVGSSLEAVATGVVLEEANDISSESPPFS